MTKKYKIVWEDRVAYSLEVEADSPEEALCKFNDGEVNMSMKQMDNEDYIQEPYVEEE